MVDRPGGGRTPLPWLAALLLVYLAAPLVAYLDRLASGGGAPSPGLGAAVWVSVQSATISTALLAVTGLPLAWLLARGDRRWTRPVGLLVQLPLALPPLLSGLVVLFVVGPETPLGRLTGGRLTDNLAGIVLAQTFVAAPFLVITARSAFAAVDPALDEVARTLGLGPWRRFAGVALPAAAPGVRAGLVLAWLRAFGEFGATVVLAYHPYSLPVFAFVTFSGSGLAPTLPPVGAGLATAAVATGVLGLVGSGRMGRGARRAAGAPAELAPGTPPTARRAPEGLVLDVRAERGGFTARVQLATSGPRLALLGVSGAGKTLTVRALAGLHPTAPGRLRVGGRELGGLDAQARRTGYLPQDAALLPQLRVREQVRLGEGTEAERADWWIHRLGLAELADRRPGELSGGQRRRVGLARALARDPELLLLDEPLSGLDTPAREELRRLLRAVLVETGLPCVLVTHDAAEAALLATDVAVLAAGEVLQHGPLATVLAAPGSPEVARLLGVTNLLAARVGPGGTVSCPGVRLELTAPAGLPVGAAVQVGLRPEDLTVTPGGRWVVSDVAGAGSGTEVTLRLPGAAPQQLVARSGAATCRPGQLCTPVATAGHVWPLPGRPPSPGPAGPQEPGALPGPHQHPSPEGVAG